MRTPKVGEFATDAVSVLIVAYRVLHLLRGLDAWLLHSSWTGELLMAEYVFAVAVFTLACQ